MSVCPDCVVRLRYHNSETTVFDGHHYGYVDRFIATGLDLDSIAAAVVGGTAFFGGRGGLLGTIAGVLIIQVLSTMVVLIGLEIETQFIIKGLVILGAVTLYGLAQKKDS